MIQFNDMIADMKGKDKVILSARLSHQKLNVGWALDQQIIYLHFRYVK